MSGIMVKRDLDTVAAEIRSFTASMLVNIIEIGRRMVEAKAMLEHGQFLPWLKEATGYSSSTANNFMRLYEEYGSEQGSLFGAELNCQTFGNLTYSKALALLSVPKNEREDFVKENAVEELSTRELKVLIAERDAAIRRAETAEAEAREEKETADALLEEADGLREQVKQLQDRPQEVIVENDPAQIALEVEKAVSAAKKAHEKELASLQKKADAAQKEREQLQKALVAAEEKAKTAKQEAEKKAAEAGKQAEADAARWEQEAQRLKKELAMADPVTAEFKGLFSQAAAMVARLVELAGSAPAETAPNLRAAMEALAKQLVG